MKTRNPMEQYGKRFSFDISLDEKIGLTAAASPRVLPVAD